MLRGNGVFLRERTEDDLPPQNSWLLQCGEESVCGMTNNADKSGNIIPFTVRSIHPETRVAVEHSIE